MMAFEEQILKSQQQGADLVRLVERSAEKGTAIHEVEEQLWQRVLALGLTLLKAYVARQGEGDLGATVEVPGGRTLRRLEGSHRRRYVSVFGEMEITRKVYAARESQKLELIPLDAKLQLPESETSLLLQHWDQAFCVHTSFAESKVGIERLLPVGQTVRGLEQMNRAMGSEVEAFRETVAAPPPSEEGPLLVVAADGKGIPLVRDRDDPRPIGKRRSKGEKRNKKRMAAVGAVYTIDRHRRTADDLLEEVRRKKSDAQRPAPQHKRVRAELSRVEAGEESNGKDRLFAWVAEEVRARNPRNRKTVLFVMDGERSLWKQVQARFANAVGILDLYHVLERLWQAAHCFCPEGSRAAEQLVEHHLRMILEGRVGYVIGALKQKQTKHGLRRSRARTLQAVIGYLENNRRFMRYDEYLAAGYPIGSGVVEGACRHLVKDRMERTGMRWRVEGAQAMLDVRATYLNGHWDQFFTFRVRENAKRHREQRRITRSIEQRLAPAA